jgi:four helix bundle protein
MGKQGFKELVVWQKAKALAVAMYHLTNEERLARDFSLRDQIRRSAVSIPSNLAEGEERDTNKESVRFFYVAKGSLAELRTQIEIASEVGLLEASRYRDLDAQCETLGKMIGSLIRARATTPNPAPRTLHPMRLQRGGTN